jgi:NADPH-dependent 2,4-dienoyl-CoA reductase/sulfur reductase-like enzyme
LDTAAQEIALDDGDHGPHRVPYDAMVIATGAAPRRLTGQPELDGLHVLRTLDDALAVRAAIDRGAGIVVVGAGFIGAEVAATARERGCEVTVIEALPVPLSRGLGLSMGAACGALHLDHGVDLRCGVGVDAILGRDRVEGVRLSDGAVIEAEEVVVGVGVAPVTDWLDGSGLTIDNGVVCNAACAAGPPGVYAAGDVARWYNPLFGQDMRLEHWTNAVEQGTHVAHNLLAGPGGAVAFEPVPYFWSDQYKTKIQFVGHVGAGDDVSVVHGSIADRKFVALYERGGRLVGALGFSMPRLLMGYRQLIADRASWPAALDYAASLG